MKRFGICFTLPVGDPLRSPHLLGDDWEAHRWYETTEERDMALMELNHEHVYSRRGDVPSYVLTKVERGADSKEKS
ncbi:MAG: hypothetical protein V2J55_10265 [Candidatus Competibacteraceae bacterium]|jgi:hypothetical protein|nr:hypothetical protein [Candidatus Competibacteraceae bacterium]